MGDEVKKREGGKDYLLSFKTQDVKDLRNFMIWTDGKNAITGDLYDKRTGQLLLKKGRTMSERRIEELQKDIKANLDRKESPPYYVQFPRVGT